MKTKIVYVLVSEETDYYYEMVLLSLYSLRLFHPEEKVELVLDDDTYKRLELNNAAILNNVTPVVVTVPSEYSVMQRSRYLKTSLRQIIEGDFLYLDCDTLICRKLDEIDSVDADLAMALDAHLGRFDALSDNNRRSIKAGFHHLENAVFFNSGVVFARDCERVHLFFDTWHSLWKQSVKNDVPQDQPALCQANVNLGGVLRELSALWNCQLFCFKSIRDLDNAFVFHYFSNRESLLRTQLWEHIKRTGVICDFAADIARRPRTLGYAVFSMNDERALRHLFSNSLSLFDRVPKLYQMIESFSVHAIEPIRVLSRIKHKLFR